MNERKKLYRKIRNNCNISKKELDKLSLKSLKKIYNSIESKLPYHNYFK